MNDVDDILEALASKDHMTRIRCASRLREGGLNEAILSAIIDRGLCDPRPNVLAEVSRLAGELRRSEALERLEGLAADRRVPVRVRKAAVGVLGEMGGDSALGALGLAAGHPNAMLRRAAMEAAGRIGSQSACGLLVEGLGDAAWQVRMDAAIGLGGMLGESARAALAGLEEALGREADGLAAEQMLRSVAELGACVPALAQRAEGVLVGWLATDKAWRLQKAAARGLGEVGLISARPVLEAALEQDPSDAVIEQILWSLARIGAASAG